MCLSNNLGQSQLFSYFCHPVRFDQASGFTCIQKSSIFVQICHFSSQNANCCDTTFDNVTAIPSLATAAPSLTTGLVTVKPSLALATTKSGYRYDYTEFSYVHAKFSYRHAKFSYGHTKFSYAYRLRPSLADWNAANNTCVKISQVFTFMHWRSSLTGSNKFNFI